jgi:hypothetical protein
MDVSVRRSLAAWAMAVAWTGAARALEALPFSDGGWELPKGAAVEKVDGREALAIENGLAYRRDVRLQDGTIEFDVQLTRRRSFIYIAFRMADDREHEELYLRPHKSGLPDAVQYAPVYQGQSAWQLYHGPGGTAAIEFEPGAWTHVRVVLAGRRAALFVGDGAKPALVVPRLGRAPRPGYIALQAFVPAAARVGGPVARYANVTVRPGFVPFEFPPLPDTPAAPGVVRAWEVSRAFVPPETAAPPAELPSAATLGEIRRVEALPGGLLELHRLVPLPKDSQDAAALARVRVKAARAEVRGFDLGFSDRVTVFLNGRPVFSGDASYSFDNPRRDGVIGYEQARVWLPLAAGDNELAVLVADGFGGWGLMGRFADASGLEITPR